MPIDAFIPDVDNNQIYAVAIPTEGGGVTPIQSYETLAQLKAGYATWQQYASNGNLTLPVPIEFLDQNGKCRILTELLQGGKD